MHKKEQSERWLRLFFSLSNHVDIEGTAAKPAGLLIGAHIQVRQSAAPLHKGTGIHRHSIAVDELAVRGGDPQLGAVGDLLGIHRDGAHAGTHTGGTDAARRIGRAAAGELFGVINRLILGIQFDVKGGLGDGGALFRALDHLLGHRLLGDLLPHHLGGLHLAVDDGLTVGDHLFTVRAGLIQLDHTGLEYSGVAIGDLHRNHLSDGVFLVGHTIHLHQHTLGNAVGQQMADRIVGTHGNSWP